MSIPTIDFQLQYDNLIDLNQQTFQAGYLDAAYHALATTFHCARELDSCPMMSEVSAMATNQLAWIDANQADYKHSTKSTASRHGGISIFKMLSDQAARVSEARKLRHDIRKSAKRNSG